MTDEIKEPKTLDLKPTEDDNEETPEHLTKPYEFYYQGKWDDSKANKSIKQQIKDDSVVVKKLKSGGRYKDYHFYLTQFSDGTHSIARVPKEK